MDSEPSAGPASHLRTRLRCGDWAGSSCEGAQAEHGAVRAPSSGRELLRQPREHGKGVSRPPGEVSESSTQRRRRHEGGLAPKT